ncbi:hypothetical protein ACHAPU_004651 [Fusarium lateritium]
MKGNITSATRKYEHTLSTVWDLAFRRLSDDARLLLEYVAFLDPGDIPVDMFIGTSDSLVEAKHTTRSHNQWIYWDRDRFNEAVSILLERNLVHRTVLEGSDSLRTHRALQMCILQELDEDLRKRTLRFNEVVSILRRAIPVFNIIKRSNSGQFPRFAKYTPQTSAVLKVFQSSEPAIRGSLDFASVLNDVCFYLYTQSDSTLAFGLLVNHGMIVYHKGILGRERGLMYMRNVVDLRKKALDGIPREEWTELQTVNFARAHADLGCVLCEYNEVGEAAPLFQICVDIYTSIKNETRLALILSNQVLVFSTLQNASDTREKGRMAVTKIESILDPDNPLIFVIKYHVAQAYFTICDVEEALELTEAVFQHRSNRLGRSHHLTLASQYFLAVLYQNLGDLVKAESGLREALEHGHETVEWREEDIVRVKFRLSIVLRTREETVEAKELSYEMTRHVRNLRASVAEFTDADDMALLDWQVTLDHFRTAGIWSNGSAW